MTSLRYFGQFLHLSLRGMFKDWLAPESPFFRTVLVHTPYGAALLFMREWLCPNTLLMWVGHPHIYCTRTVSGSTVAWIGRRNTWKATLCFSLCYPHSRKREGHPKARHLLDENIFEPVRERLGFIPTKVELCCNAQTGKGPMLIRRTRHIECNNLTIHECM